MAAAEGGEGARRVVDVPRMECPNPRYRWDETPSVKAGISEEAEVDLRIFGCELIQTAGRLLGRPQVVMACAQILFQRFFCRKSFVRHPAAAVAAAAVFLAAKVEEAPRPLKDIINVVHHILQRSCQAGLEGRKPKPLHSYGEAFIEFKAEIIVAERRLLKELGFCVHVPHPHKLVTGYLGTLKLDGERELAQCAWNYMNDALRTTVFVKYRLETIACACLHLAFCKLDFPMPAKWYEALDARHEDVLRVSAHVVALYTRKRRTLEELEQIVLEAQQRAGVRTDYQIAIVPLPRPEDTRSQSNTPGPGSPAAPQHDGQPSEGARGSKLKPSAASDARSPGSDRQARQQPKNKRGGDRRDRSRSPPRRQR